VGIPMFAPFRGAFAPSKYAPGSEDQFNEVLKYSCHVATDNSFSFADFSAWSL